jgi:hypothetical protein
MTETAAGAAHRIMKTYILWGWALRCVPTKAGARKDAFNFCQKNGGGKELCLYVAYCPNGEGYQSFPGHPVDFNQRRSSGHLGSKVRGRDGYWLVESIRIARQHVRRTGIW